MNTETPKQPIVIGSRVEHKAAKRIGTVVAIHDGAPGERLIEYTYGGQWYVSSESVLTIHDPKQLPWRRSNESK